MTLVSGVIGAESSLFLIFMNLTAMEMWFVIAFCGGKRVGERAYADIHQRHPKWQCQRLSAEQIVCLNMELQHMHNIEKTQESINCGLQIAKWLNSNKKNT